MSWHKIIFPLFFSALFTPLLFSIQEQSGQQQEPEIEVPSTLVARHNQASLLYEDDDFNTQDGREWLYHTLQDQKNPPLYRKRATAFEILKLHEKALLTRGALVEPEVLDEQTLLELELICGKQNKSSYIGASIDRSLTELGKVELYAFIAEPINDIQELHRRQTCIQLLQHDKKLYDELHALLECFADTEPILFSFWKRDDFKHGVKNRFFNISYGDFLNKSSTILGLRNVFEHQRRIGFTLIDGLASSVSMIVGCSLIASFALPAAIKTFSEEYKAGDMMINYVVSKTTLPDRIAGVVKICAGAYSALFLKNSFEWMHYNLILDKIIHEKTIKIAAAYQVIKRAALLGKRYPDLRLAVPSLQACEAFVAETPALCEQGKALFSLLESSTFKGKPSHFAHRGKIFLLYKLFQDYKQHFEHALVALGELDAYLSLATLCQEYKDQRVSFCFAEYEEGATPHIQAKDFWHPMIDAKKVVSNSITLGGNNERNNIVVTGPNAGGKSTLLKALAVNLILAQSIGIVPAQKFCFTPFEKIMTDFDVIDDLAGGNSLFKAEVVRAHYLLDEVQALPENKHAFIAIDEMGRGTSPVEGEALSYAMAYELGQHRNVVALVATHYPLLTQLAFVTDYFENYHVSVLQNSENKISYPFKLEKGISHQHVALEIVRNEGLGSALVDRAQKCINDKKV